MEPMERIAGIEPADQAAYAACQAQLNQIAKPLGSLGKLETLLCRVAAASGTAQIDVGKKCVLVFCADNGVVAQGVAQNAILLHGEAVKRIDGDISISEKIRMVDQQARQVVERIEIRLRDECFICTVNERDLF